MGRLEQDRGSGVGGSRCGDVRGGDHSGQGGGDGGSDGVVHHVLVVREGVGGDIGSGQDSGGDDSEESEDGGKLWMKIDD